MPLLYHVNVPQYIKMSSIIKMFKIPCWKLLNFKVISNQSNTDIIKMI